MQMQSTLITTCTWKLILHHSYVFSLNYCISFVYNLHGEFICWESLFYNMSFHVSQVQSFSIDINYVILKLRQEHYILVVETEHDAAERAL